jgi:hypothetical protein
VLKAVQESETYELVGSYAKIYPKFIKIFEFDSPIKQRISGLESRSPNEVHPKKSSSGGNYIDDSLRRTKTAIADITICNDFDLFVTFTFKKDRYDIQKTKNKMSKWLKNQRELHGKFDYVIVPEFHKDKKAIHFHALFKGYKGKLHKTKIVQKGRPIYNITSYKLGFSTAAKIDNVEKVSSYVRKYITKDMPQFPGKKHYWVSNQLKRPITQRNPNYYKNPQNKFTEIFKKQWLTVYRSDITIPQLAEVTEGNLSWKQLTSTNLLRMFISLKGYPKQDAHTIYSLSNSLTKSSLTFSLIKTRQTQLFFQKSSKSLPNRRPSPHDILD